MISGPMISKELLAATAAAVVLGAVVFVMASPVHADDQYWGAIAYSPLDGASGNSSQQATESDAKNAAISDCSNNGGVGCEIVVTVQKPNCASLVSNESLYSWGVAPVHADATESAMADLGEPGSEVTFTCGFIAGTVPAQTALPATPTITAGPTHPHPHPLPPAPAPNAPAPTLR